jgi:hypothetical protein
VAPGWGSELPWQLSPDGLPAIGGLFRGGPRVRVSAPLPRCRTLLAGVLPTVSPLKACSEALLITRCSRASPANARHWPGAALRPHFQGQPMARPFRVNRELMAFQGWAFHFVELRSNDYSLVAYNKLLCPMLLHDRPCLFLVLRPRIASRLAETISRPATERVMNPQRTLALTTCTLAPSSLRLSDLHVQKRTRPALVSSESIARKQRQKQTG